MRFNHVLNNFTSGEWSTQMRARTDTEQYARAATEITNGMVRPQGGVFRRPGFSYDTTFNPGNSVKCTAIPLDDILIVINNGNLTNNIVVYKYDGLGTVPTVETNGVSPFGNTEDIRHVRIGDTIFCVRTGERPFTIVYDSNNQKVILRHYEDYYSAAMGKDDAPWKSYPFGPINSAGVGGTLTITGADFNVGTTVNLSASLEIFNILMSIPPFPGEKPNTYIRVTSGGSTGVISVSNVDFGNKTAQGKVEATLPGTSPLVVGEASGTAFEISAWTEWGGLAWPDTITAIQGRLVFGSRTSVYFTRSGNVYDLMELPFVQAPDDAFEKALSDGSRPFSASPFVSDISKIVELTAHKTLVILTDTREIVGYGGPSGISALPGGFNIESSSSFGAARVAPIAVNNYLTYVQREAKGIRDLVFNWEQSQYQSMDLSFPAEHLFRNKEIVRILGTETRGSHLWAVTQNGDLYHCSLDRDYNITAWSRVEIKGYRVLEVANIKGQEDKGLKVICAPEEQYGTPGPYSAHILSLNESYDRNASFDHEGMYELFMPKYMDILQVYKYPFTPGPPAADLSIYEGKQIQLLADGFYLGKFMVDQGAIVDEPDLSGYGLVYIGLPCTFRVVTNPVEAGAQMGDSTGRKKRITDVFIRLWNTLGGRYGSPETREYYDIPFREDSQPMNEPSRMRDMDIEMSFPSGYHEVARVEIESDYPFPCNVLAVGVQGVTNE